ERARHSRDEDLHGRRLDPDGAVHGAGYRQARRQDLLQGRRQGRLKPSVFDQGAVRNTARRFVYGGPWLEVAHCSAGQISRRCALINRTLPMKLTPQAKGTFAIAPTPFHDDGRIDDGSIDRLCEFYREAGCNGITVLGIMGEAPKLDGEEGLTVATRFVKS